MIKNNPVIYLASSSPRRKKLLQQLNIQFKTIEIDFEEKINRGESPVKAVKRLSVEKMNKAKETVCDGIVITADTIVVLNGRIIGKPADKKDAERILLKLSNKTHVVYTGFCIANFDKDIFISDYEKTFVRFRKLDREEIKGYIDSGSPMDKAGAYGIQDDFGAVFVKKITGCYYNVVGLPLAKIYTSLLKVL